MLLLIGAMRLLAQDKFVLNPAESGAPYAHALETNRAAHFEKCGVSNAPWLIVTPDGVLIGTPVVDVHEESEITVCAYALDAAGNLEAGRKPLIQSFVVPVQPSSCARGQNEPLAWCGLGTAQRQSEPKRLDRMLPANQGPADGRAENKQADDKKADDKKADDKKADDKKAAVLSWDFNVGCNTGKEATCIIQFDRLDGEAGKGSNVGRLGTYNTNLYRRIDWSRTSIASTQKNPLQNPTKAAIIRAINGSRVFISGSVLVLKDVDNCGFWAWSVLAQTGDSSNNLYYGPSDVTAFCADERDGKRPTALLVLPTHAIWANVYGVRANTNDPTWKPSPEPPVGHECWTGKAVSFPWLPKQGIEPCDKQSVPDQASNSDEKANWFLRRVLYWPPTAWVYNRGAQPGVSQGSISITPIAGATKSTWDVQTYGSTLLGPGWIGLQGVYEHDRNLKDDLNSFTAALTYDVRSSRERYLGAWWGTSKDCAGRLLADLSPPGECGPPIFAFRPMEFIERIGPEWSPDSFKYKSNATTQPAQQTQYLPRNLNLVMGSTLRLPLVFSPKLPKIPRQPSQFALAPVGGLEGGFRMTSHPIGLGTTCAPVPHPTCGPQPQEIFRLVAGVDASARSPYNFTHNFFGDRPLTVDFSYRMRWLYYKEPFANTQYAAFNVPAPPPAEGQSTGERSYTRITFIQPVSAYLQLRSTWQHGSLPPLFQYVGNQVTFGLTFSNPGSSEH